MFCCSPFGFSDFRQQDLAWLLEMAKTLQSETVGNTAVKEAAEAATAAASEATRKAERAIRDANTVIADRKYFALLEDFGGSPDLADNSEALQAALDSGRPVLIHKDYHYVQPVTCNKANTTIYFFGGMLHFDGEGTALTLTSFCRLWYPRMYGNVNNECNAIYIPQNAAGVQITGGSFTRFDIAISGTAIIGCVFDNITFAGDSRKHAFKFASGFGYVIRDCLFNTSTTAPDDFIPIVLDGGGTVEISNNYFYAQTKDLIQINSKNYDAKAITIRANHFGVKNRGVVLHRFDSSHLLRSVYLVNNNFDGSSGTDAQPFMIGVIAGTGNQMQHLVLDGNVMTAGTSRSYQAIKASTGVISDFADFGNYYVNVTEPAIN